MSASPPGHSASTQQRQPTPRTAVPVEPKREAADTNSRQGAASLSPSIDPTLWRLHARGGREGYRDLQNQKKDHEAILVILHEEVGDWRYELGELCAKSNEVDCTLVDPLPERACRNGGLSVEVEK
jgi:hypothetical protein